MFVAVVIMQVTSYDCDVSNACNAMNGECYLLVMTVTEYDSIVSDHTWL